MWNEDDTDMCRSHGVARNQHVSVFGWMDGCGKIHVHTPASIYLPVYTLRLLRQHTCVDMNGRMN